MVISEFSCFVIVVGGKSSISFSPLSSSNMIGDLSAPGGCGSFDKLFLELEACMGALRIPLLMGVL